MQRIAESHIEGNVPDLGDFSDFLRRDLLSHLSLCGYRGDRVEWEMLRKGPTQTGVAFPKFYLWVRAFADDGSIVTEGAMRVAAVGKDRFEVTHYLTPRIIRAEPGRVDEVFPAPLVGPIRSRAGSR